MNAQMGEGCDVLHGAPASPRQLGWRGCFNVRDLGGQPTIDRGETRWHAVVRADNLARLDAEGWKALRAHGVRTVIDLRYPEERMADPADAPVHHPACGVDAIHRPLFDHSDPDAARAIYSARSIVESYTAMLDRCPRNIAAVVGHIARAPGGAVVVHCQSGRDRTGLIAALLLALADVERSAITHDYALSATSLEGIAPASPGAIAAPTCQPGIMERTLSHLERHYGSAAGYLAQGGLETQAVRHLRARLRSDEADER